MDDTNFTAPPPAAPTPDGTGMRKLNERATKIFMTLVEGLRVGDARKLDNARGAFMAVSVDFLVGEELRTPSGPAWALYAIAHNYLANGDLIPDPDVEARRHRIVLTGDVPSPDTEIRGCPFRTRCPKAFDRCAEETPLLKEHRPGHAAACFLHEK